MLAVVLTLSLGAVAFAEEVEAENTSILYNPYWLKRQKFRLRKRSPKRGNKNYRHFRLYRSSNSWNKPSVPYYTER